MRFSSRICSATFAAALTLMLVLFPEAGTLRAAPQTPADYGGYRVGVAKEIITPKVGSWLAGFRMNRKSWGVHDNLEIRVLAIADGSGKTYAFITADLIGFLYDPEVKRLRERLDNPGLELFVLSSHNHQGPDTIGIWGRGIREVFGWRIKLPLSSGRDEEYIDELISQMERTIRRAVDAMEPLSRLQLGTGEISDLCINKRESEFLDTELSVLGFDRLSEKAFSRIAVVANFGCHPETVNSDNRLITSDFPGVYRDLTDGLTGAMSFFVNGALGAMVRPGGVYLRNGSFAKRETFGQAFHEHVLAALSSPGVNIDLSGPIRFSREEVTIPLENRRFRLATLLGILPRRGGIYPRETRTEVSVLRLGEATLVMVPGEIVPELGLRIKQWGGPHTQVWSLANDEIGYILNPDKFHWDMYRYEAGKSVGPEAGRIIMKSVRELLEATR